MLLHLTGSNVPIAYEPQGLSFVKNRVGSPARATAELGFTAEVPLEEGMQRLIAWRRQETERRGEAFA